MKTSQAGSAVGMILSELVAHTKTHFKAEEDAMRRHGYPGLADHQRQHSDLIQKVAEPKRKWPPATR